MVWVSPRISLLGSCLAVYAFISAKSVKAAPATPHAESGTIIGLASPMAPKADPPADDLKADTEKGKEVRFHQQPRGKSPEFRVRRGEDHRYHRGSFEAVKWPLRKHH